MLLTPPPLDEEQWRAGGNEDREAEVTRAYAKAVGDVVRKINESLSEENKEKERVALVDMWTAVWEAAGEREEGLKSLLSDGLHFTEKGYEVGFQFVNYEDMLTLSTYSGGV